MIMVEFIMVLILDGIIEPIYFLITNSITFILLSIIQYKNLLGKTGSMNKDISQVCQFF